jgi:putative phosphoesterase
MKIAAIYDIHANLPALEAVLGEIDAAGADLIVVGGDVAAGPLPRETLDRLRALGPRARFVRGNADRYVMDAFDGAPPDPRMPPPAKVPSEEWAAKLIDQAQRDFMATFAERLVFPADGLGNVLFCHATPRNDYEVVTALTPEPRMREVLAGVAQPVVVCGHTHMQFDRRVGDIRMVNAGSVGMPYGDPGAYWALLGPDIDLHRTLYDFDAAARQIRASGYLLAEQFVEHNMLHPPSAADALAVFEPPAR